MTIATMLTLINMNTYSQNDRFKMEVGSLYPHRRDTATTQKTRICIAIKNTVFVLHSGPPLAPGQPPTLKY